MATGKHKKTFRYSGECKLPSCKRPFKTNRKWQEFCPKTEDKDCQQKWHQLLKKKHEDIIVEIEVLKEGFLNMKRAINTIKETFEEFKKAVGKIKQKEE